MKKSNYFDSQPLVNKELSKASRGVPPIGQVSSKTPNTPQTKLSSSSRETEATYSGDACESKKDNTAEANSNHWRDEFYEIAKKKGWSTGSNILLYLDEFNLIRYTSLSKREYIEQGKKEMLEAVEKIIASVIEGEWKEYCEAQVNPRNISSNLYVYKQQIKRKMFEKLAEMKVELNG